MSNNPVRPGLLKLGCAALEQILAFSGPADVTLRRFFSLHRELGRRDRGFIAETIFAVLRRLRYFTQVAGSRRARPLFIVAADVLPPPDRRELDPALSPRESHWLSEVREQRVKSPPPGVEAELPDWLVQRLAVSITNEQVLAFGRAMQSPAPLDLRVNTLLGSRDQAIAALLESGFTAHPTPYSPFGLRIQGKPALENHPLFLSGRVEVQDEGSQLLGLLLAPRRREMVVDFCAGAGGKTLLLGQLMRSEGRLYAFDVSARRMMNLRKRLARSGLSNVHPEVIAHENDARLKRLAGKIDRVLVDAPCTGIGTLRRNPDLKWRQSEADVAVLTGKQATILESAAKLAKRGGRIEYATCSLLVDENDAIVDAFLSRHPEFVELDCKQLLHAADIRIDCGKRLRLIPHEHGTDGFFAAVLERRNDA